MLYLVLFATLGIGFVVATNISAQVGKNDRALEQAGSAADSGMHYMRYQLATIILPYGTTSGNLLTNVASQLNANMSGTPDMGSGSVTVSSGTIYIPSKTGWITADSELKTKFQATITQSGDNLIVTTHGTSTNSNSVKGVQLQFKASSYSMIGLNSINLSLSAYTDSYDATKGAYSAVTAGHLGSIASNGNITLINTAKVDGDARSGIGKSVITKNSATVTGSSSPLQTSVSMKSVTLPATYTDLGDVNISSGTMSLPGGVYRIGKLVMSGTAKFSWTGPVQLYVATSYSITGSAQINTFNNLPANRTLHFLPTCTTATWGGTNVCIGELYAPDTDFTISGNVELFGRITAKSITNSSSGGFHSDESLPPCGIAGFSAIPESYIEVP